MRFLRKALRQGAAYSLIALGPGLFAEEPSQLSRIDQARQRVELLSARASQCDHRPSEGESLVCYQGLLSDCESEINQLDREVRSGLPASEKKRFDHACAAWRSFYAIEESHHQSMRETQGSVRNIGYLSALVNLLLARCEELVSQL